MRLSRAGGTMTRVGSGSKCAPACLDQQITDRVWGVAPSVLPRAGQRSVVLRPSQPHR